MTAAQESYDTWEGDEEYYEEDEGQSNVDKDIQIGEEIVLTHEEVWDDSALIEAWDSAVKQYELYHNNPTGDHPKPRQSTKETRIGTTPKRSLHSTAPSRSGFGNETRTGSGTGSRTGTNKRPVLTNEPKSTPPTVKTDVQAIGTITTATTGSAATSTSTMTGARDAGKKSRLSSSKGANLSSKENSETAPAKKKAKVQHDWAAEDGAQAWQWSQAATSAPPGTGDSTAFNPYNPYAQFAAPPYPYYMSPYPGASTLPPGLHGAALPPPPPPMMPWGIPAPPVPPSSTFMPPFLSSGDAGAAHGSVAGSRGMDDESLGNLIMAWYYSGYYTGLYQARRQR
ncbi:hypothetical protein DFQ27_007163 [Actinomortierella ambigua]|uniref:Survival Motor Neuron Gemin2-binding domain-containing protein n=1 Tax=Actinomortierella ambigua TaxID=1343610 RepID=A0A9P6PVN8_9FUNG|nr:hypothetical protein DFQ27_007163 [Actinomortierella ambigua]